FCAAWRAVIDRDGARFAEVTELAGALRGSSELGLETGAQGRAFADTQAAAWPGGGAPFAPGSVPVPIAEYRACAPHCNALEPGLAAYLHGFAANLTSAGVRLVPLGQTAGQRVLASLEAPIARTVVMAVNAELDDAGSAAWMVDWCSMQHETQH